MAYERPGQSPFYPEHPVPVESFVGRPTEIERLTRAVWQVAGGRPQAVYIEGDYGVGKTSLARLISALAQRDHGLLGIHVFLGAAQTLNDVASSTLEAALQTDAGDKTTGENIRAMLARYIGEQGLFGITLRFDRIEADAPSLARGFLPFLDSLYGRIADQHTGLILTLDEINGLARNRGSHTS